MSQEIVCPACQTAFFVLGDAAGGHVRCPAGHWLALPEVDFSLTVPAEPDETPAPAEPAAGGRGGLILILTLLGLLVVGAFAACVLLVVGERSAPPAPEAVAAPPQRERPVQSPPARVEVAQAPPLAEEPAPVREEEPPAEPERPQPREPGPPPVEQMAVEQKKETHPEEKLPPAQLMLGRMDRLERDRLDVRSSKEDGATRAVWDGHTNHVRMVSYTADGRFVLSVSGDINRKIDRPADYSIRVWDARTGTQVHKLDGFPEALDGLCVSPGGRFALFGHGGHWEGPKFVPATEHGLFLWDVQAKQVIGPLTDTDVATPGPRLSGLKGMAFSTDISPDRKTIVAGDRAGYLTFWETETGRLIRQVRYPFVKGKHKSVQRVRYTPDGKRLVVVGYDRTMRVYQADGEPLYRLPDEHRDIIWGLDVAAAKDERTLALTGGGSRLKKDGSGFEPGDKDYAIRLWDIDNGSVVRTFEGHTRQVCTVAFCPDGRHFVSGGHDKTVRLWDLETGRNVVLGRHDAGVRCVAVAPDGRSCVSGGYDCKVRFWQLP